jgi:hypothetical protein
VRAEARAEAAAGVERQLVVAQPLVARTAAERPAEVVAAAERAEQPALAGLLAAAVPKPLAARPRAAGFLAAAGPKPLAAWQPAGEVAATAEQPLLVAPRPAGPQQAAAGAEGAEEPQAAGGLPGAWLQRPEAAWAASQPGSRTPRGRRS